MRRIAFISYVVLAVIVASAQQYNVPFRPRAAAGGAFCDGSFQFCEESFADLTNFDATAAVGSWSVSGGHLVGPTSGTGVLTHDTAAGGATQYVIVRFDAIAGDSGVFFRGNSAGGWRYKIYAVGGTTYWGVTESDGSHHSDVESCSITWANDDYLMATVSGTGTSTVVSIWKTATMPTAPPSAGPTCGPFTNDPSAAANDGLQIGIFVDGGASGMNFDDFAGGGS